MMLSVLGRCGPYPRANEACSGYLLQTAATNLLLECGSGVLSRLRAALPLDALDGVVLSHLHYDHCADMSVLRYALEQNPRAPLPVYCPGAPEEARRIFDYPVFDFHELRDGLSAQAGDIALSFHAVEHSVPCYGVRMKSAEASLFFTGDTGWFDGLCALAAGADALLCDCCFTNADVGKRNNHLSAAQAGKLARDAGVKTLFCTHLSGGGDGGKTILNEVGFDSAIVAEEGCRYKIRQ